MHGTQAGTDRPALRGRRPDPRRGRGVAAPGRPRRGGHRVPARASSRRRATSSSWSSAGRRTRCWTSWRASAASARSPTRCPRCTRSSTWRASGSTRPCARCDGSSTAASGSRATRSTSISSTRRTSSAARAPSSSRRWTGRRSSAGSPSRRPATGSCRSSAAGRSTRSASGSAASRGSPRARELEALRPDLERALEQAQETVDWVADVRGPGVRAERAPRRAAAPRRVPVQRGPDRLVRRSRPRADRLGAGIRGGTGPVVARAPGAHGRPRPVPPRTGGADHARGRPAAPARLGRARSHRSCRRDRAATRTGASPPARWSSSTPSPRRSRSSTAMRRRAARASPGRRGPGTAVVGDRGAAWPAVPPLRARRARPDRQREDRAADEPEPGGHRGGPRVLRAVDPGRAARRRHAPARAC